MRPFLDDRLFPGLPKFLWFDNGSSGDGSSGDGTGTSNAGGMGGQGGAPSGTSTSSADAAAAGMGGVGSAGQAAGVGGFGSSSDAANAGVGGQTSVGIGPGNANAGVTDAAAANMGFATSSPGVGPAGGVSTAATTSRGGGATSPGASTGGTATGGGGGTAAGGSGVSGLSPSVVQALRSAIANQQLAVGGGMGTSFGVPSLGVPQGVGGRGAAPVGQVTVSPLGPPSVGTSLGNAGTTDQVSPPGTPNPFAFRGVPGNMGFPAAGLAHTPTGGYTSSLGAPTGSNVGQATINAPPTNPDVPAVGSHNANGDQGLGGLAAAASTAVNQSNPSVTGGATASPSSPNAPNAPIGGGDILSIIMNLVASDPQLAQLAQSALTGSSATANRPQNVLSGAA